MPIAGAGTTTGNRAHGASCGALYGLAAIPKAQRSPEVRSAITHGIDFLTEDGRLLLADYPTNGNRPPNPLWFKLNFPLFYQADLLFTLRVLGELDALESSRRPTGGGLAGRIARPERKMERPQPVREPNLEGIRRAGRNGSLGVVPGGGNPAPGGPIHCLNPPIRK